jgi:Family of unknown function (DUF5829)
MRVVSIVLGTLFALAVQADDTPPAVFFSHFYVDLDKDTYHALQECSRILSLADHELAHKTDGHAEYTGFYLRGRHTYMEFFGDPLPEGDRPGNVGVGLWVEQKGGVQLINERLRKSFGDQAKTASTTYPTGNGTVPWYTATYVDEDRSNDILATWIAETDSGYLAARHPGSPVREPLSREQYLSWDFKPDRLLDDVIGLKLELPPQEATLLSRELAIAGWQVIDAPGGAYTATGPDMKISVMVANGRGGLRQADLRLRHAVGKEHHQVGAATLDLGGRFGRLVFPALD